MPDEERNPPAVETEDTTKKQPAKEDLPQLVPGFHLLQKLGEGGMGEVFEAEQLEPVRRRVALKLIKRGMESKEVLARFDSERQALALMSHPNIAQVYDAGTTTDGRPFFVMEIVQGVPVTRYCDTNRLNTNERLELFNQICEGVQHAHHKGVIHRDIKPSNVLVKIQDSQAVPKIIDFGVAKAIAQRLTEQTLFTAVGEFIGTPEYMSPEQAEMTELDIDTRTDVYSLGVVLYELLVGAQPFDARELRRSGFDEMRRKIREEEPPRPSVRLSGLGEQSTSAAKNRRSEPSTLARQLRGDLDWITMKALEKDRTRRYDSPGELAADISRHLRHQPVLAGPPSAAYRLGKFVRRHRAGVAATVLATLAVLLGAALALHGLVRAGHERDRAQHEARKAQAISLFLMDVLASPDPYTQAGLEALRESERRINDAFTSQPEVQASVKQTVGEVYRRLGRYDEAEALLKSALETRRAILGDQHVEVADSLFCLASVHHDSGDLGPAEEKYREALEIRRKQLGEDHPDVALSVNTMARLHRDKGDVEGAEALFREALEMRRRGLGARHPDVAVTLKDLAQQLRFKGDLEEAEKLCRQSLDINLEVFGREHPGVAADLGVLGSILMARGSYDEAERLFRESLEIERKVYGESHEQVGTSLLWLGHLLRTKGALDEAEIAIREAIGVFRRARGREHSDLAVALANLAVLKRDKGQYEEALPLFEEVLRMQRSLSEPGHWAIYNAQSSYGACLLLLHRYQEAEEELLEAHAGLAETLGPDHSRTVWAGERLVEMYDALGKHSEAESYRRPTQ